MPLEQTDENDPAHWFEFARERLRCADVLVQAFGPTWTAIELLQEAVERFLKGYLIATGWRLRRVHDLQQLMHEAAERDARFVEFFAFARELTEEFFAVHYPGGNIEEIGEHFAERRLATAALLNLIEELVPPFQVQPPPPE
jgi:HEPN domain-containing protein